MAIGRSDARMLANNSNRVSVFICGDLQFKLNRVMNKLSLNV